MESNEQEKSNLLNDNPIAAQAGGSFLSKHMGGGVSPLQSKGSMAYQKEPETPPKEEEEKPKVKKKIIKFPKIKLPKPPKGTRLSKKEIKKLKN